MPLKQFQTPVSGLVEEIDVSVITDSIGIGRESEASASPMRHAIALIALVLLLSPLPLHGEGGVSLEGTVMATEARGGVPVQTFYTRKDNELRIENPDKSKPEPVNIVDLAAKKLTIVYPHNSSFVVVDLTRTSCVGVGDPGGRVPGGSMPVGPGSTIPATTLAQIGPSISPPPGFPTPPPMPSMPSRPNNPMASGIPPMPGGMPMPSSLGFSAPPMPPMGGFGGAPELKKTDQTRKIQGFDCTLYTISDRMQTFEIWATPDSALFPFRLLEHNYNSRHFGPQMLEQQWVELLQKQSLFPLEATLRQVPLGSPSRPRTSPAPTVGAVSDSGPPLLTFKVDKIDRKKIDDEKLFQPPEGYFEIQSPTL